MKTLHMSIAMVALVGGSLLMSACSTPQPGDVEMLPVTPLSKKYADEAPPVPSPVNSEQHAGY